MADTVTPSLTAVQLGAIIRALDDVLDDEIGAGGVLPPGDGALVAGYFALVRAQHVSGGWKPHRIGLAVWAVTALSVLLQPPAPTKKRATPKPARRTAAQRKRAADAARRRRATKRIPDVYPYPPKDDDDQDLDVESEAR